MQLGIVLNQLEFDLLPQGLGAGDCGQNICYHVATFCDSNKFDMQHDYVLKKLNVSFFS